MNPLKVALVVPDYSHTWDDDSQFRFSDLNQSCHAKEIDLVVFPESYECVPVAQAQNTVAEWASTLQTPVLMGVQSDGFELAVYHNPNPRRDDTTDHAYVKHSSADRLAYEWPDYQGPGDAMFLPIRLKGTPLGVQVCHDMFYGLVGHRLRQNGAQMLIDLTYGNVNLAKWRNIVRGRSLEFEGPFLCTMAYDPEGPDGDAAGFAYRHGRPLSPIGDTTGPNGWGGYVVFDLGEVGSEEENGEQSYSQKVYKDITLSLGSDKNADMVCRVGGQGVEVTGAGAGQGHGQWLRFGNKAGSIGVLPLPLAALWDALAIHRLDTPKATFDHHLLLYHSPEAPASPRNVLSLMKLRAVEHRVGVALIGGNVREVLKTSSYKNIQRMAERNGIFGLNSRFLGGTWSTARPTSLDGVPYKWFAAYRSLMT
jgi:predicted amidohydrolase